MPLGLARTLFDRAQRARSFRVRELRQRGRPLENGDGFGRGVRLLVQRERRLYNLRYSRSRRVCVRLTGISVAFASFIRRM